MNEDINWRKHVVCSAHWSSGKRENKNQLPDIICTKEYAANLEKEYSQQPSRELKRKTWPSSRIDLPGCCFQIFAHIVNMFKKPVGPK